MAPPVSYGMKFTLQHYQAAINYIKLYARSFLCKINLTGQFIYFNIARFDSIAPNMYKGNLSGLLEANFGTFNISKDRFDHFLEPNQVFLF